MNHPNQHPHPHAHGHFHPHPALLRPPSRRAPQTTERPTAPTAVLTSVSCDSHTWNLVYLHLLLEENGWRVVNLGACTPDDTIIEACERVRPDLLVVSTVNGHGHLDGARLATALRERPRLAELPAIIGGKLGVAGALDHDVALSLLAAGFDEVFDDGADQRTFVSYVNELGRSARPVIAR